MSDPYIDELDVRMDALELDIVLRAKKLQQTNKCDRCEQLERVAKEIQSIMQTYREQEKQIGGIGTPGGLEHMGDVWELLHKWDEMLRGGQG